jgi:cell division protein FtsZ
MVVFGCGGAGGHIISRLEDSLKNVPKVAINTDMEGLRDLNVDRKICIGKAVTFGNDSGGFPEIAGRSAELAVDEISNCLISKDIVFIVAGLGGGSGTGISPFVAKVAKGLGLVAFGIVILPFSVEGSRRALAEEEVEALRSVTESTIVLDNDSLQRFGEDITLDRAFHIMDRMVVKIINDVGDRMSRSFMATIADEILAYHSDVGTVQPSGLTGYGSLQTSDPLTVGMNAPAPGCPTADHELVNMGGMFQRI